MHKKMFVYSLSAFIMSVLPIMPANGQSAYFQAVTNLGPAAYWPLQEAVQPPAVDVETNLGSLGAAGNAYYSSTNAVQGFAPGAIQGDPDPAVSFSSALNGGFLAVPTASSQVSVPVGPFTVEAWVYPTNGNQLVAIVSQTGPIGTGGLNGGTNSAGWSLNQNFLPYLGSGAYANSLVGWSFHVFNGAGSTGGAEADAVNNFSLNTWYHIVGVYDGTNCTLYVDGINATSSQIPMTGSYVRDTWDQLTIGCGRGLNANRFGGAIDEVAIYTNALSAAAVANDYAVGTSGSGNYPAAVAGNSPYMYWRMDAPFPAAAAVTDYPVAASYGIVANLNGLYLQGTTPGVAGPHFAGFGNLTNACAFNGIGTSATNVIPVFTNGLAFTADTASSGILITNLPNSLNLKSNNVTAMVWFKANPADIRFQTLMGHGDSSWRLSIDGGASGSPGKVHWNPGEGGEITSAGSFNDGNWHFAVGVYTNAGPASPAGWLGTNYLYVDGILNGTSAITNTGAVSFTNALIGGAPDYAPSGNGNVYRNRFFSGSLAHAAYFTNALTASQIINLYTNATGGTPPPPFITSQPFPYPSVRQVNAGAGVFIFEAVVASGGTPALGYQWYYNGGSNYVGATALVDNVIHYTNSTTSQVTITNLTAADTGYYFCIVTNNYGATTSGIVNVQITTTPVITAQSPAGAFKLFPNQNFALSVSANGGSPLAYQWFTNNVADITAGTAASYSLTGVQPAMSGETFQCIVTNSFGSATSALATLTVVPYPAGLTNSSYGSNVLALSPTAYWPMHESAPSAPADVETNYGTLGATGNGYWLDWVSPIATRQIPGAIAGDPDPAVQFYNTSGDCLIVPHSSPLTTITAPYTLEAWVKPLTDNTFGTSYQVIMGQGGAKGLNGSASLGGFALQYGGTPSTFSLVIWNGTATAYEQKTTASYPPGVWYHLVCTFDGTNVAYYVNNQLANFGTLQSGVPGPMSPDSWSPLCIGGGRWGNAGAAQPFIGAMDEVAVYPGVLSATSIGNHYAAGTTVGSNYMQTVQSDTPLIYYRMNSPAYATPPASTWPVLTNYGTLGLQRCLSSRRGAWRGGGTGRIGQIFRRPQRLQCDAG